jgi:hypothetical protein
MAALDASVGRPLDHTELDLALRSLAIRLDQNKAAPVELVVCGGSALILTALVTRTTRDVDVVALLHHQVLCSPAPLPEDLQQAVREVAEDLLLPDTWLNNGPSRDEGGLFQLGLPDGLADRLTHRVYGERLIAHFIGRLDQIYFKLYAAVDRGGYHIKDLLALQPTDEELAGAGRWAMTHDVSDPFASILKSLLRSIGHGTVAERL